VSGAADESWGTSAASPGEHRDQIHGCTTGGPVIPGVLRLPVIPPCCPIRG